MPRTPGARDKQPRVMAPASLAALPQATPGHTSATVRIFAPTCVILAFCEFTARERGRLITEALAK